MTASLGIARYPNDGRDWTTLIRNADIAMYRSKEAKIKKITMFESSLDQEVQEYFKIKNSLRNAINNGELFLDYQPIIDVERDQIVGAEALLRWKYSDTELIPPLKFIPIAEKNGLMQSIGEWVLKSACRQNRVWQKNGYKPIFISVNVSIIQLEQPDFYEIVVRALEESELSPKYLQLEITETIFTKSYDRIVQVINKLNRLGVKMAIDDFGTGYSSLGQLSRLEIDKLKIDKSFISEICKNENKIKIVKAIISMAESLNLELIAEGVETIEQLEFLKKNECRMIQGYIYSKPTDGESIKNFLVKAHDV
jgi:EAL domain-containing protein (putative c-di-GMP-specific phosphodiesterase class I)